MNNLTSINTRQDSSLFRTVVVSMLVVAATSALAASPIIEPAMPITGDKAQFASTLATAEAGDANAQVKLGNMHFNGVHTPVNYQEALHWYEKAAEQGNANAIFNIGVMHDKGFHVDQNFEEALKWYQKAAALDFPEAIYNLGIMYEYGQAVTKDYAKAQEYYLKAAQMGEPSSQFALGLVYDKGLGVERDPVLAYMWWDITGKGHMHAEHNRDSLAEEMTPEQISEAKRLAAKWRKQHADIEQLPPQVFPPGFQ
ncbi:MAG TPA: hypothetical protein DIT58_10275 [Porticoccaceae bacterium]|nr:hypothetical protein [Porticoccaceae bacterium]